MSKICEFNLEPGRIIGKKFIIIFKLGGGWEGEVSKNKEVGKDNFFKSMGI